MREKLQLRRAHLEEMRAHVESCSPQEACGLLAGKGDAVARVLPIENQERSPSRFRMNAREQLRAFRAIEEAGLQLVGIFHSHPSVSSGQLAPSATDIQEAAYPVVQVIWFQQAGSWTVRGFWIEEGRAAPVTLQVDPGE